LIWFHVDPDLGTAQEVAEALKQRGILALVSGSQVMRAVTHLDVSAAQAERAAETIRQVVRQAIATA